MHHQTVAVAQKVAGWIEHVQVDRVLGIESVCPGCGAQTDRHRFAGA
jgi:hypothetical protein